MALTQRSRNYTFTLNNYTDSNVQTILAMECKYIIVGYEIAPTTGTPHLQGYIMYNNARSFNSVIKDFPNAHIEIARGTPTQNFEYCSKSGKYEERGQRPRGKGSRSDIEQVKTLVKEGSNMREILEVTTSYQSIRYAETLLKYYEKGRDWEPEVIWCYGPTGSGKSRWCVEQCGDDYYISMNKLKWWEGYDSHTNVIIDEFRGDYCTYHELLRILDRYPYRIEVKGGSRQLLAKRIFITSCYHPSMVYKTHEDVGQLLRRISQTIRFVNSIEELDDTDTEVVGNTMCHDLR